MIRTIRTFLLSACAAAAACGQEPAPQPAPPAEGEEAEAGRRLAAAMKEQFAAEKIRIDGEAGTATIPAVMNEPRDPIEYVLIHRSGKMHEAMFFTFAKPSVLNAALLLLGFERGRNATYREKDPPPTLEEIQKGADPLIITPPEGMQFWMTVRFAGPDGKPVEYCVEDLLYDLTIGGPVGKVDWIYLGGRMASLYRDEPEVFVADFEGNLVSACYLSPDNHLGTMRHERARDDQNWWLTDKCPAPGTEIEFTIHRHKPPLVVERERRLHAKEGKDGDAGRTDKDKDEGKDGDGRGGGR